MVGDHHELGEGGSSHDSVIGGLELGDLEVDVLGAVVLPGAKCDRQGHSADWGRPGTKDDVIEGLVGGHQGCHVIAHALYGADEDDVEGIASIDEYFGQKDLADHERVRIQRGKVDQVIVAVDGNRYLRPPQGFNRVFEHQVDFMLV